MEAEALEAFGYSASCSLSPSTCSGITCQRAIFYFIRSLEATPDIKHV